VRERAEIDPILRIVSSPSLDDELDSAPVTSMAAVLKELTDEKFDEAVRPLSPKLRVAYELRSRGLRHAQIADLLNITQQAVAKRLFDARKRLRALLGGAPPPSPCCGRRSAQPDPRAPLPQDMAA